MKERLIYTAASNFESARSLPQLPDTHRSGRLHGHSFLAKVAAVLPQGWSSFPGDEVDALRKQLQAAISSLDYNMLNHEIPNPNNENISRWLSERIGIDGLVSIGVEIGGQEGFDLLDVESASLWRRYRFESAHQLPNVPEGHKCGRMHGHGFQVILHMKRRSDPSLHLTGMEDYDELDRLWGPIQKELDHVCLNDISGLENPTSELLSSWIWAIIKPTLPSLSWVTVYETDSCGAHFDGQHYRIWKEMSFDSAVQLKQAPEGDMRRRIHGHTYTIRLHLQAPLDKVMGWTCDFGDVKALFEPVFKSLDHRPLYETPGVADADAASLALWTRGQVGSLLPEMDRIDLFETYGCGVSLRWGSDGPVMPA